MRVKNLLSKLAFITLLTLISQTTTTTPFSQTKYIHDISELLYQISFTLFVLIAPLLLIYGLLKGALSIFPKSGLALIIILLIPLAFISQTTPNYADILKVFDTFSALLGSFFLILLPAIFILLIWKAFVRLVKL